MKNKGFVALIVALIIVAGALVGLMILVPPPPPAEEKVPLRLGLTANPTTVGPGGMVNITFNLLDENGNLVNSSTATATPVSLELRFEEGGSLIISEAIPPGGERTVKCSFNWPFGTIVGVKVSSGGLISNTTAIAVVES